MAEAGIPIATIMARAGHCSPKMTAHYTNISSYAERIAMQGMTRGRRVTPQPPERPPRASSRFDEPGHPGGDRAPGGLGTAAEREQHASAVDPVQAPAKGCAADQVPGRRLSESLRLNPLLAAAKKNTNVGRASPT